MKTASILLLCVVLASCGTGRPDPNVAADDAQQLDERAAELSKRKRSLERFFQPMRVREGDWLESVPEDGETFERYVGSQPTLPTPDRRTIYIQPAGEFSKEESDVIRETAEYMKAFFDLPVTLREPITLGDLPPDVTRMPAPDHLQIHTSYFIDRLLPGMLPPDGAALICLTSFDLYPGDTMNYVFGQASLDRRVGVWSLWRLGKDNGKRASRDLLLARTLKIAMHETGHMFSMRHCTKYECLMSGSNHLDETDRHPLDTCPECSAKISWAMGYPLEERYKRLAEFWEKQGRFSEQQSMTEKADALCNCMER